MQRSANASVGRDFGASHVRLIILRYEKSLSLKRDLSLEIIPRHSLSWLNKDVCEVTPF